MNRYRIEALAADMDVPLLFEAIYYCWPEKAAHFSCSYWSGNPVTQDFDNNFPSPCKDPGILAY